MGKGSMRSFFKRHWSAILSVLGNVPSLIHGLVWLFDWYARADLVVAKLHETGGLAAVLAPLVDFILNPPPWLIFPAGFIGTLVIVWDIRRARRKSAALNTEHSAPSSNDKIDGPIKIHVGEGRSFYDFPKHNLYARTRRLKLAVENTDRSRTITNCKLQIVSIEPDSGFRGPWILAENLTITAGDRVYIPIAQRGEAISPGKGVSSDTSIEICVTGGRAPLLPTDSESTLMLRATAVDTPFCDLECKLWVDGTGVMRIRDTKATPEKRISLLDAAIYVYDQTRHTLAGQAAERQGSNESILTYYCYALTTKSRDDPDQPLLTVYGVRPPSRTVERLEIDGPSAGYKFIDGKLVLEDRRTSSVYENLAVLEADLPAAIADISKWGNH